MTQAAEVARMIAYGIRDLRRRRGYTQAYLGQLCGMDQSMIARLENPDYRQWTFRSLIRVAAALRARLRVRFNVRADGTASR